MTVQTFYRCAVWLPLLVPALVAFAIHGFGLRPTYPPVQKLVQLLLMSLLYGGLPYLVLAAYATWWIDDHSESQIRRKAVSAPLWMAAAWLPLAAVLGILSGRPDTFLGLVGLGIAVIFPLGYAYVALVFILRELLYSHWLRSYS